MNPNLKKLFPSFSNALIDDINANAFNQLFVAGDVIMRTGQYVKNTILVLSGSIKIYREDEDGEEFLCTIYNPGKLVQSL